MDTDLPDSFDNATDIVKTLREPLLVLDAKLKVKSASRAYYRLFQTEPSETIGRRLPEPGNGQ